MADTPKIRFKGFADAWGQRKLEEMLSFSNGFNGNKDLYGSGIPYISVMDILNNDVITHDVIQGRVNVDMETAQRYLVEYGDVLFQRSSENIEDAGRSNVFADAEKTAIFGGFVIRGKKVSEYNMIFMKQNLETQLVRKQIMSCAQGAQHINVGQETLGNIKAFFPSLEEQKKIGDSFNHIDSLITLHQHKCDETKELKKYMLQKMFPRNGKKNPEIRFVGFTDDWEQRKLGEIFKERTERATGDEELLSVTIGNGVIRQADSDKRNIASEDKSNYKIVRKGDVPYNSMRMWQGAVGNSEYDGIVSPAYTVLVPTAQANGKFFMELFKKESTLKIFQRWSQGLTSDTWNLKYPVLSSIEFYIPLIEEQTKIAEYFKSLDYLISLYQRKCDDLREVKKFMLQNMFPKKG